MKTTKKCAFLVLWLIGILCLGIGAMAAPGAKSGIDAVLVLDSSGSLDTKNPNMTPTDPDLISFEAAKVFIDMVEMNGSRVGVVIFGTDIEKEVAPMDITSDADKQRLKDAIDDAKAARQINGKGDTDIGEAAQRAVQLLKNAGNMGNEQAIVFFTDGDINFDQVTPDESQRASLVSESTQQAKGASADAADNGIRFYTIGLNSNGSLKDDSLISEMAQTSNGKLNKIQSAEEVPGIFFEIFAELIQSKKLESAIEDITITDPNQYGEATFNIPNSSVTEANITMRPQGGELQDVLLVDPAGNQLDASDPNVYLNLYAQLGDVKLVSPTPGDWTLRVKGTEGVTITSMLVMNSDVAVTAEVQDGSADETALVTARLQDQSGNVLTDTTLYESFVNAAANSPRAEVTSGSNTTQYPLTFDGSAYTGEIPVAFGETVTVTVYVESDINSRYSNEVTYTNNRVKAPITIETSPIPSPIRLTGLVPTFAKEDVELDQYFTISEGSMLIQEPVVSEEGICDVSTNGYTLNLKGKKNGTTTVTITAEDMDGTVSAQQNVEVIVDAAFPSLIPIIAGGIGILVFLLALIILLVKLATRPKLKGTLAWVVKEDTTFGTKNPSHEDLTMMNRRDTDFAAIITDPAAAFYDLDKMKIKALKNGIRIINNTASCQLTDEYGGNPKSMDLQEGMSFAVLCQGDGAPVIIACEYLGEDDGGLGGGGGFDDGFGGGFGGGGGYDDGFGGGFDDGFGGGFDDDFGGSSSGGRKQRGGRAQNKGGRSSGKGGRSQGGGRSSGKGGQDDGFGGGGYDDGFGGGFDDGFGGGSGGGGYDDGFDGF